MKICFDGIGLSSLKGRGLYSYTYALVDRIRKVNSSVEYNLLWDGSKTIDNWKESENVRYSFVNVNRHLDDYSELEVHLGKGKYDIYHSPNNGFSLPKNKVCPYIITVHDLIALSSNVTNEKYIDKKYFDKFMSVFPEALKRADCIIAVSSFIKNELLTYFKISEEKIKVIYPCFKIEEDKIKKVSTLNILKYKYGVEEPFILFVGSISPRKQLRTLISAFKEVKRKVSKLKLVIVGDNGNKYTEYYKNLVALGQILGVSDSVIFTGLVPREDLNYFYKQCLCLVNLSEYEGFPIASVEAMYQSTPLVCGNIDVMNEVVGKGGVLVDQRSVQAIQSELLKIAENEVYRRALKEKSITRSDFFNENNSIRQMISIYDNLS